MKAADVTETLKLALKASDCDKAKVIHRPRLLSDKGASYLSGELAEWLNDNGMDHVRGAPYHPQTQGNQQAARTASFKISKRAAYQLYLKAKRLRSVDYDAGSAEFEQMFKSYCKKLDENA